MLMTIRVFPDDGEKYDVEISTRDVYTWERTTKRCMADLQDSMGMADLYRLAWIASRRHGLWDGKFEEFAESVDLERIRGVEESGPTPEGALDDSSSPSPSTPGSLPRSGPRKATRRSTPRSNS